MGIHVDKPIHIVNSPIITPDSCDIKYPNWNSVYFESFIPDDNRFPIPPDNKCVICGDELNKFNHCTSCKVKYGKFESDIKLYSTYTIEMEISKDFDSPKQPFSLTTSTVVHDPFCRHCGCTEFKEMSNGHGNPILNKTSFLQSQDPLIHKYHRDKNFIRVSQTKTTFYQKTVDGMLAHKTNLCKIFKYGCIIDNKVIFGDNTGLSYALNQIIRRPSTKTQKCPHCGEKSTGMSHIHTSLHPLTQFNRMCEIMNIVSEIGGNAKKIYPTFELLYSLVVNKNAMYAGNGCKLANHIKESVNVPRVFFNPKVMKFLEANYGESKSFILLKDKIDNSY